MTNIKGQIQGYGTVAVALPLFTVPRRRRARLNGSCAVAALLALPAAISVGIMLARPAQAQTLINSDKTATVILGNYLSGNPFLITSGTTITAPSGDGVFGGASNNWTMTNYGVVVGGGNNGIGFSNGGTIVNGQTASTFGTISGQTDGVYVTGAAGTVNNYGLITGAANHGVEFINGGTVTNNDLGTIVGADAGITVFNASGYVDNSGTVIGVKTSSTGIDLAGGGYVYNTGTVTGGNLGISVESGGSVDNYGSVRSGGNGISISGVTAYVYNRAGDATAYIYAVRNGIAISTENGTVNNAGIIKAASDAIPSSFSGVYLGDGGTVTNTGTVDSAYGLGVHIVGDGGAVLNFGLISGDFSTGVSIAAGGGVYNYAGGTISGLVGVGVDSGGTVNSTVGNSGLITGAYDGVSLINGAGTFGPARGTINSVINYGTILQTELGGPKDSAGVFLSGGDSNVYNGSELYGFGTVANAYSLIQGTTYGVVATGGTTGVENGGTIIGSTNTGVMLRGSGVVANFGDVLGALTGVTIYGDNSTVYNASLDEVHGPAYISGSNDGVLMTGAAATMVNFGTVVGVDVTEFGTSGTGVSLGAGGYVTNATGTAGTAIITGGDYGVHITGAPGAVGNDGYITALATTGTGVALSAGGYVSNSSFGTIAGGSIGVALDGGGSISSTVNNHGLITGTAYGVSLEGGLDGAFGEFGTIDALINFGTILQTSGSTAPNAGVIIGGDGAVYNGISQTAFGAQISGNTLALVQGATYGLLAGEGTVGVFNVGNIVGAAGSGILFQGTGLVDNSGSILGGLTGVTAEGAHSDINNFGSYSGSFFGTGFISGANDGVLLTGTMATMVNIGTVVGYSYNGGNPTGTGVSLSAGGGVLNFQGESTTSAALISGAAYGVDFTGYPGFIANDGLIIATNGTGIGVALENGGSLTNSTIGTISGGAAGVAVGGYIGSLSEAGYIGNAGLITGGTFGVSIAANGGVYNGGGGTIDGALTGVLMSGGVLNTVINAAGGTIFGEGYLGVALAAPGANVMNAGIIAGYFGGVVLNNGGSVYNAGLITAGDGGSATTGIVLNAGGYVVNTSSGTIYGYTAGIRAEGAPVSIYNAGTILAPGEGNMGPYTYQGVGIYSRFGGTLANVAGGLVEGLYAGVIANGTMDVSNSGSIIGGGGGGDGVSLRTGSVGNSGVIAGRNGVYIYTGNVVNYVGGTIAGILNGVYLFSPGSVGNSGTIVGLGAYGVGVDLNAGGTVTNTGVIGGSEYGVYVHANNGTVINSGTIYQTEVHSNLAAVYLYDGGTVMNTSGGTLEGASSGVVVSYGGGTIINAGLIEGIGYDGVSLNHGGSVVNSSGGVIVGGHIGVYTGYAGASVNNYGYIRGSGGDGVSLYQGGQVTNHASAAIFSGYNGVYVFGSTSSVLNYGFISAAVDGVVANGGSITNLGSAVIVGGDAGVSSVDQPVYVNNTGVIFGATIAGVDLTAGGTVTNADYIGGDASGIIIGGAPGVVVNYGGIIGRESLGVALTAGGYVLNQNYIGADLTGVQISNGLGTVVNNGGIIAHQSGNASIAGVALLGGGYVVNTSQGYISGYGRGVDLEGAADSLVNAGSINGYLSGVYSSAGTVGVLNMGTITGQIFGVLLHAAASLVNTAPALIQGASGVFDSAAADVGNAGTIFGTLGAGVALYGGGTVTNTDVIGGEQYGVSVRGAAGTVTNSGAIGQVGGLNAAASGVYLENGGSLENSGLITAYNTGVIAKGTANIMNSGTISGIMQGGVVLYGGNLVNMATGTITGIGNAAAILEGSTGLDNGGLISNLGNAHEGVAADDGLIINRQTGTISGSEGVSVGDATLFNAGLINGSYEGVSADSPLLVNYATGMITGGKNGVYLAGGFNTLLNAGTIGGGSGFGVTLTQNGIVTNYAGGLIEGNEFGLGIGDTGTVANSGTIAGGNYQGVSIDYGSVVNNAGGAITGGGDGISSYKANVTNAGYIMGGHTGIDSYQINVANMATGRIIGGVDGVSIYAAGSVVNAGSIAGLYGNGVNLNRGGAVTGVGGGVIYGDDDGVFGDGPTSVDNSGVVEGIHESGVYLQSGAVTNRTGATISGYQSGVTADDSIDVTNAGLIASGRNAVRLINGGYVGNAAGGTITALQDAVRVEEAAGTVINDGQISSTGTGANYAGVNFFHGGEVENAGLISGGGYGVILNGFGGTVVNMTAGRISGGYDGVSADGGTIVNAGSITGVNEGVYLDGGTLTNMASGVIKGGAIGLYAYGADITNAGLIADDASAGAVLGDGDTLTNLAGGTISGVHGIDFTGTMSSVFNAGTIASTVTGGEAVAFENAGMNFLTLTTGSVIDGVIDGGGSDSEIDLTGTGSLSNAIQNFGAGSALNVASGANWTASGDWTVAAVTNNGTFQAGLLHTPLSLTGSFVQAAPATLRVVVTPTLSSQFIITGAAQLAGNLTYVFAPGYYKPHTYNFLTATDGVSGNFANVNYTGLVPFSLTRTTNSTPPSANLVLAGSGVVTPADDSLFGAQSQAMANSAQEASTSLLGKASLGAGAGAGSAAACAAEEGAASDTANGSANTASRMASAVASAFCGAGGWIEATGTAMNADASGGAPDFHADSGGFLAGIDRLVNHLGTRIGLAVGYDETWLHDGASGKGTIDTARVGLYASQPVGRFTLAADFLYGHGNNTTSRATGVGQASANYGSDIVSGGIQGSTEMTLGPIDVVPAAGLRIAHVSTGGFAEHGGGLVPAFAVSGTAGNYTSVQPFVNVGVSHSFLTGGGLAITPSAGIGYDYEAGDRGKSVNVTADDFSSFAAPHNNLDASTAVLSAGIAAGKNNWSLYAHYTAYVSGNWTAQTAEAGLQVRF